MAESEPRLILVDSSGATVELTSAGTEGAKILHEVRTSLEAGINSRLLVTRPYIHEQLQTEPKKLPVPPKYYPEIPLADELERQRYEATERIAVPLGIDRERFQAELPTRFPDRRPEYDILHLNVPLIDPNPTTFGFTWLQMTEAVCYYDPNDPERALKAYIWDELRNMATKGELRVWKDPRKNVEPFPEAPHAVWIQDGTRYINRKPNDVRKELHLLERAGDHFKGTALAVLRPDMIKPMFWDLVGGSVGVDRVPDVGWRGGPGFRYLWDDRAAPGCRALVCGSEFTVA